MPYGSGSAPVDWEDLYRRHAGDLRKLIAARVPSDAVVEDILQETFIRAYRSCHRFDPARAEWPWLATLAHRSCTKWWRSHRGIEVSVAEPAAGTDPRAPGTDDHLARMEQRRAAVAALAQMESRHRRILYLREAEDFSYECLAHQEQLTYKALKSLLGRARSQFRSNYLRLIEESVAALVFIGRVSSRVRERLSSLDVGSGCERLGTLIGMALFAGIVSVFSVTGSAPPARTGADARDGARAADDAVPISAVSVVPPDRDGVVGAADPQATPGAASDGARRPGVRPTGGDVPLAIRTSGGLTHGTEAETANLTVDVDAAVIGRTTVVRHEVKCNAGKIYAAECTVMRAIPPAG